MRKGTVIVLFVAAVSFGCAASIPPPATFAPSAWRAVEALSPGTLVRVSYVTASPAPLRHTFEGVIEAVTPDLLQMRTADGMQRLLANQVLRVSTLSEGGSTFAAQGALIGAGLLTLIGAPMLRAISERDLEAAHVLLPAALGMGIGAFAGSQLRGTRTDVVYVRR